MEGPIPFQILRPEPGKFYVCQKILLGSHKDPQRVAFRDRRITEGFGTEAEAKAEAARIEAAHPFYRGHTEIWPCPNPDTWYDRPAANE